VPFAAQLIEAECVLEFVGVSRNSFFDNRARHPMLMTESLRLLSILCASVSVQAYLPQYTGMSAFYKKVAPSRQLILWLIFCSISPWYSWASWQPQRGRC
jgi:hypothetical protein